MKPKTGDTDIQQQGHPGFKSEMILLYKANSSSGTQLPRLKKLRQIP